jgi:formylglycine-generating enzyme required for sulfatase activity
VVGVSFWEAEAFCAWAGGRLPTEEEWEAAARGRKELVYPWGDAWRDGICNTSEAGLGVTSPVGLFPRARQAHRAIEDLAGNVFEWCASLYDPKSKDFPDARVRRGGSWYGGRVSTRSSGRFRDAPNDRSDRIGFRVVCVAHP